MARKAVGTKRAASWPKDAGASTYRRTVETAGRCLQWRRFLSVLNRIAKIRRTALGFSAPIGLGLLLFPTPHTVFETWPRVACLGLAEGVALFTTSSSVGRRIGPAVPVWVLAFLCDLRHTFLEARTISLQAVSASREFRHSM